MIHPGRTEKAPLEIVNFIDREGGDLSRTVMSHVDIRVYDRQILRDLACLLSNVITLKSLTLQSIISL